MAYQQQGVPPLEEVMEIMWKVLTREELWKSNMREELKASRAAVLHLHSLMLANPDTPVEWVNIWGSDLPFGWYKTFIAPKVVIETVSWTITGRLLVRGEHGTNDNTDPENEPIVPWHRAIVVYVG